MGEDKPPNFDDKVTPNNLALATSQASWPEYQTTAVAKQWCLDNSEEDQNVKNFLSGSHSNQTTLEEGRN